MADAARTDVPALALRGVSFRYPDGTLGLEDVSFTLAAGEAIGVVGPNGAGKSTLAQLLPGLLVADSGSIAVCGTEVTRRTLTLVRRRIGLVFEHPDDQLFLGSLLEDVAFGPANYGATPEEARARALRALAAVGLEGLEDKFPGHLSSGQKRAAAIATVLALEPDVVVLDEPSANLDPRARRALRALITRLPGARVVISHDLELVLDCCPRVLLFDRGRLIADGRARALLGDRALVEAHGLELPLSLLPASEHAALRAERRDP